MPNPKVTEDLWKAIVSDQIRLNRLATGMYGEIDEQLATLMRQTLRRFHAGLNLSRKTRAQQLRTLQPILAAIQGDITKFYTGIKNRQFTQLTNIGMDVQDRIIQTLNVTLGNELFRQVLNRDQWRAVLGDTFIKGKPLNEWWNTQSKSLKTKFTDQLREGFTLGEGNDALANRVQDLWGQSRRQTEAIVRTGTNHAANQIRYSVYRQHASLIKFIQWVSTLDNRTTVICIARDGSLYQLDGTPVTHEFPLIGPPAHVGCRSTTVPVIKGLAQIRTKLGPIAAKRFRASMFGPLDGNTTFDDFLNVMPNQLLQKQLGRRRMELYRTGKITRGQLLDGAGNVKTIDQLIAA